MWGIANLDQCKKAIFAYADYPLLGVNEGLALWAKRFAHLMLIIYAIYAHYY